MLDVTRQRVSSLYDHSPWNILFRSLDPISTARGDLLKSVILLLSLYLFTQYFGTGLRLDLYPILHLDFILDLFRMLA